MSKNPTLPFLAICLIIASCGNDTQTTATKEVDTLKSTADAGVTRELQSSDNSQYDRQVEIVKQMVWENLRKVPGTDRDYESEVKLRIGNGNLLDADVKLIFPKSSWLIASILVDDYKEVLKRTNTNVFAVIYKMISDP